jgi:hypothetical protein
VARNLREQIEASRSGAQQLSEQAHSQQQAGQEFARESVEAYAQFLDTAFFRYQIRRSQTIINQRARAVVLALFRLFTLISRLRGVHWQKIEAPKIDYPLIPPTTGVGWLLGIFGTRNLPSSSG